MSDRVLVPLSTGQWLSLSAEEFRTALVAGSAAAGPTPVVPDSDEPLVDAEQLAEVLALPVSWISQAAREQKIPCVRAGRWVRFKRSAVERALANGKS